MDYPPLAQNLLDLLTEHAKKHDFDMFLVEKNVARVCNTRKGKEVSILDFVLTPVRAMKFDYLVGDERIINREFVIGNKPHYYYIYIKHRYFANQDFGGRICEVTPHNRFAQNSSKKQIYDCLVEICKFDYDKGQLVFSGDKQIAKSRALVDLLDKIESKYFLKIEPM